MLDSPSDQGLLGASCRVGEVDGAADTVASSSCATKKSQDGLMQTARSHHVLFKKVPEGHCSTQVPVRM